LTKRVHSPPCSKYCYRPMIKRLWTLLHMNAPFFLLQVYFTLFVLTYSYIMQILHFASVLITTGVIFCFTLIQIPFAVFLDLRYKMLDPQANLKWGFHCIILHCNTTMATSNLTTHPILLILFIYCMWDPSNTVSKMNEYLWCLHTILPCIHVGKQLRLKW
jgi:hypothetical protein